MAAAHWGATSGFGDDLKPLSVQTDGLAGTVVGFAGPAVVGTGGSVAAAAALGLCDAEVGDLTGGAVPGVTDQSNEREIEETTTRTGQVPDNTWDDGGYGMVCHVTSWSISDWNTEGCGETTDHGYARANPVAPVAVPVFVSVGCDLGTTVTSGDPVTALLQAVGCTANQVFENTPGEVPQCLAPVTGPEPAPTGFAHCGTDGTPDAVNTGYADEVSGPPVPTKTETQNSMGGIDCSSTDGATSIFVYETVDASTPAVSGPATHAWTTGQR